MSTLTREWLALPHQYDRFTRYLRDSGLTTATRLLLWHHRHRTGRVRTTQQFRSGWSDKHDCAVLQHCCRDLVLHGWSLTAGLGLFDKTLLVRFRSLLGHRTDNFPYLEIPRSLVLLLTCVIYASPDIYIAYFHNPKLQIAHLTFSVVMIVVASQPISSGRSEIPRSVFRKCWCRHRTRGLCVHLADRADDAQHGRVQLRPRSPHRAPEPSWPRPPRREGSRSSSVRNRRHYVIAIDIDRFKTINDVHGHNVATA